MKHTKNGNATLSSKKKTTKIANYLIKRLKTKVVVVGVVGVVGVVIYKKVHYILVFGVL